MTLCETRLDLNDEAGRDPDDVNFYVLMKICETQVGNLYFSKTIDSIKLLFALIFVDAISLAEVLAKNFKHLKIWYFECALTLTTLFFTKNLLVFCITQLDNNIKLRLIPSSLPFNIQRPSYTHPKKMSIDLFKSAGYLLREL
jgi:hypothetical protein